MAANNYQFDATGTPSSNKSSINHRTLNTTFLRDAITGGAEKQLISPYIAAPTKNNWPIPDDSQDNTTTNNNLNPYGGIRTSGGGAPSTPDYSSYFNWVAGAKPQALDFPEYKGTGFYNFDETPYTTAKQGIQTGIGDARTRGDTAFNLAAQRYLDYQDPYAAGPQTYNPGVDPRLMDSMAAWGGAGSDAALGTYNEGVQADAAMGSVYDLLGRVGRQFNEGQLAGIEGDRMQLDQRLGSEERMLGLTVDMALARAKSQYEKDKWMYGEEIARMNYEANKEEILYNTQSKNQFNQGILNNILEMLASKGRGIPTNPGSVYA